MQGKSSKAGVVLVIVLIIFLVTAVFLTFRDRRNRRLLSPRMFTSGSTLSGLFLKRTTSTKCSLLTKSHDNVSIEHRVVPLPANLPDR